MRNRRGSYQLSRQAGPQATTVLEEFLYFHFSCTPNIGLSFAPFCFISKCIHHFLFFLFTQVIYCCFNPVKANPLIRCNCDICHKGYNFLDSF